MRSIFRYPGGKSRAVKQILSVAPFAFKEYREPFVGGGSVFFSIPKNIKRWINDINLPLIEVYKALKNRPEEFIKKCKDIKPAAAGEKEIYPKKRSKGKKYNARLKKVFDKLSYNIECDQALRYLFINRTVWGGRVNYDPAMKSRMYFSNPAGWNVIKNTKLNDAAYLLKNVHVTSRDYATLLERPGDSVWVYCDPPYIVNTRLNKQSQLYACGFSEKDHIRFVKAVKECKHRVCISYDRSIEVKKWFKKSDGFYIHSIEFTYCGTSSADGCSKKKKKSREVLITNYPIKKEKCSKQLF